MTNGLLEALNGLFHTAKRKAHDYRRLSTIRTIISLLAGKLDLRTLKPACRLTHSQFKKARIQHT